jgi:hypothetical protein
VPRPKTVPLAMYAAEVKRADRSEARADRLEARLLALLDRPKVVQKGPELSDEELVKHREQAIVGKALTGAGVTDEFTKALAADLVAQGADPKAAEAEAERIRREVRDVGMDLS